jgi:membrane-associated phospholipid phosphatase
MIVGQNRGTARLAVSRYVLVGVAALALAGALAVIVASARSWVQPVDDRWLRWMVDVRWPPLTWVAKILDVIGGGTVMWILRAGIVAALAIFRRWRALVIVVLAEVSAELCIGPIKAMVDRARPAGSLVVTSGQAFPSGHALTASVTAFVVVLVLVQPGRARVVGLSLAAAWSLVMAVSRTYLAAHWMSDSLAGLLIGTGWALLWAGAVAIPGRRSLGLELPAVPAVMPAGRDQGGVGHPTDSATAGEGRSDW